MTPMRKPKNALPAADPPPPRTARAARKTASPARRAPPQPDALDPFDLRRDSLGYLLRQAQMHAYSMFFEMLGPLELSPARLTALSVIASETHINQVTLAKRLNVAGPSVMKLIDALEGSGYIRRMEVASDRRQYSLALTASGRALMQTVQERHAVYEERLASPLSAAERELLMGLLKRLVG